MPRLLRCVSILLLLAVWQAVLLPAGASTGSQGSVSPAPAAAATPAEAPPDPVVELMAHLTLEQKIGQLFLTSFAFEKADKDTDIYRLIKEQHIGSVVLQAANRNFVNNADTPQQVAGLTNALQALALESNGGVPLFVAADHEGDGFPYQRLTGGMTALPNPMAIGATWNPDNAAAIGEITGKELSALGINLLLGPVVDVLNNPRPTNRGDIGTRSFGGDPWWVAQMGRSYICGVHRGSGGRVATVAKHFPGHGGSDRLPDQEVATVDKSLTELKRIELPPFFAVAQASAGPEGDCAVTEAMMTSHIRYRGLQGNIRQFTAPISFDRESLATILGLPEFAAWQRAGLVVSDALGVPAVARYFDPTERTFPHRQIAKEALMAGNDLLTIGEFARPQAAQIQYANLVDTVNYFREEYQANPEFRQRVDDAAARVLRAKLKVYGGKFERKAVQVDIKAAPKVAGKGSAAVAKIAREALTMLQPSDGSGHARPAPPRREENIVIFTDAQRIKDCPLDNCELYEPLPANAVQDTILRLYGPAGSGQVDPARVHSLSFADLKTYLESRVAMTNTAAPPPTPADPNQQDIGKLVNEAQWIVFAMRDVNRDSASDAVRLFLDSGSGRWYETKVVVMAFNAPYYLDTTEVNKLTLYLAAYSKAPAFVEAAVRALFGEFEPGGRAPVNVDGLNYDLLRQLAPDPARPFAFELAENQPPESWQAPSTVHVRAGPVVDRNGNTVPDGTEVVFEASYEAGGAFVPAALATTVAGQVEAGLTLREPGTVAISARSGEAVGAQPVRLVIAPPPTIPAPTSTATSTPEPTDTPTPVPEPTAAPSATPTATATPAPLPPSTAGSGPWTRTGALLLALLGTALAVAGALTWPAFRTAPASLRLRAALLVASAGLAGYIFYLLFLQPIWPAPLVAILAPLVAGLAAIPLAGGARFARS